MSERFEDDAIEIEVLIVNTTDDSIYIDFGGRTTRLEKDLIEIEIKNKTGWATVILPRWLAEEKNLI